MKMRNIGHIVQIYLLKKKETKQTETDGDCLRVRYRDWFCYS